MLLSILKPETLIYQGFQALLLRGRIELKTKSLKRIYIKGFRDLL